MPDLYRPPTRARPCEVASAPVRRALSALVAVLLVAGCGSSKHEGAAPSTASSSTAPSSSVTEQSVCPSEQKAGIVAVFGHRQTTAAAQQLSARAEHVGFRGLLVQRRGCNDFAVDLYGMKTRAQRHEIAAEARRAGFRIVFELG